MKLPRILLFALLLVLMLSAEVFSAEKEDLKKPWTRDSYYPEWEKIKAKKIHIFRYSKGLSKAQNGSNLAAKIRRLRAGEKLYISQGIYEINGRFSISLKGEAKAPIWILPLDKAKVVLTRNDNSQNVINIEKNASYIYFGGFEIYGGSTLISLGRCSNIWIDKNKIHDGDNVGITANSGDCEYIYITRNEIYRPGGNGNATSEGLYLGGNHGKVKLSYSVVALNHIYECRGSQGDGIELKQGSFNNWIVENYVHDTNYPCILAYGTGGNGINVIEGNVLLRSNDNTLQVQGDALIKNNLVINGKNTAFNSRDHQGKTQNLTVINNTFINSGVALNLGGWNNRKGLFLYNNIIYSEKKASVRFPSGSKGVVSKDNYIFGNTERLSQGIKRGKGLQDFLKASWDGSLMDFRLKNEAIQYKIGTQVHSINALTAITETEKKGVKKKIAKKKIAKKKRKVVKVDPLERKAKKLYNLAARALRRNKSLAKQFYKKIIEKYPSTKVAKKAKLALEKLNQ